MKHYQLAFNRVYIHAGENRMGRYDEGEPIHPLAQEQHNVKEEHIRRS